jgi:hypothetical protein
VRDKQGAQCTPDRDETGRSRGMPGRPCRPGARDRYRLRCRPAVAEIVGDGRP